MTPTAKFCLEKDQPLICAAIHAGELLSPECKKNLAISTEDKLREEDPFTDQLAMLSLNNIIGNYSRFEFDVNRKRDRSIYLCPEDSWGLEVRKEPPGENFIQAAYAKYDLFYEELYNRIRELRQRYDKLFIYDIHSYNHRRMGIDQDPDDQNLNPDIILATGNMSSQWDGLIDELQKHFSGFALDGKTLDVRKNVKFDGGWFSRWLHYTFPDSVCCLSIEFKKIFMDEWSGKLYQDKFNILKNALQSSFPIIENYLDRS
jgi:N-formylglutamate amidohydrolase